MKIVLFNKQEKAGGGIGVFTSRLKKFLQKQGHEVFEIRYTNEPESKEFYKVPYIFAEPNAFIFLPHPKTRQIIRKLLKEIRPDVVYLPVGSSVFDLYMPRICRKLGIALMGVCHTDISRSTKVTSFLTSLPFRFYLPVCRRVGRLQVFTEELKSFFVRSGVSSKNIVVIPNGVDQIKYSPGRSKVKKYRTVLFIGRMTWIKNPEILIKAFLESADSKTKLIFVGKGDLLVKLRKKYQDKRIVFLGQISDEAKKIEIIRNSDVFVLPSKYEGMSLSLLEAMSCGLCCITTDVASHRQVLDGAGVVIPFQDLKKQLPIALKKTLTDLDFSARMGRKARERILRYYSEKAVFARITKEFVTMKR